MQLFDSITKTKCHFEPIVPGEVSIYVCGPTVYDDAHLGHARSALAFDLLSRTLNTLGYKVTMGKNFTDIDDKIIQKVIETGKSMKEVTQYYIDRYLTEMAALGVQRADIEPRATTSLDAIKKMIQTLIDKGYAYIVGSGDIYFDTSKDTRYGKLSRKVAHDDNTLSRIEHNSEKRNLKDFALWKACKDKEDICFDSPFSLGRPGWHIECSAMIETHFNSTDDYSIDIHGGGADLLFPHHENEAAQSRCATGRELAKYWMHNGFVQIDGEKMSKSLGNSFFLKDALKIYDGEVLRYYLNSIHYRNDFNFNEEDLQSTKKRLDKLYRLKKRLLPSKASVVNKVFKQALLDAMSDDLNISVALSIIDEMITQTNDKLDENPKEKILKEETIANIDFIEKLLGFGGKDPYRYFQIGVDEPLKEKIETLLAKRIEAKKAKDFATSDAIRSELAKMGIAIMDTPKNTIWERVQ
ncbi:MAG: cysteine--tRNA ligase [Sulfurovum sp.]|nr:cysteine--tRNA ligase [Sulfurovum sp.]MCB4745178.1 cysteine--tRNA ligase [Sulfurovum sp.]MCB4745958.1 cysteine--tRNA ligase [Sulfurovum sp.]MCB4749549.1 cysteine--tRNA ligase [Sulfurovum sp.]MCB4750713.1 cysteine--tRNA ligase [Sulfurovum sp.]